MICLYQGQTTPGLYVLIVAHTHTYTGDFHRYVESVTYLSTRVVEFPVGSHPEYER